MMIEHENQNSQKTCQHLYDAACPSCFKGLETKFSLDLFYDCQSDRLTSKDDIEEEIEPTPKFQKIDTALALKQLETEKEMDDINEQIEQEALIGKQALNELNKIVEEVYSPASTKIHQNRLSKILAKKAAKQHDDSDLESSEESSSDKSVKIADLP